MSFFLSRIYLPELPILGKSKINKFAASINNKLSVCDSIFAVEKIDLGMLFVIALKGVPAFYLQAIMASENDINSFVKTGERRDLNRERFDKGKLVNY